MSRKYEESDVIVTNDSLQKSFKKITDTLNGLTVEVRESGGSLLLIVRGDESYEGCTIKALSKLDNREYTKILVNGIAIIKVKLPGEYFITNTHSDTTITCTIGEPFIDEIYFTDYYGSINVTVPELLIGETLEAKNGEHTVEKEIKSTVEVLDVYNQGTWSVGIKGTEFITPQEATLTEMGESKTVQLSIDGAAYITVTLADEIKDERITCKNNEEFTRTKTPIDGKVQFFVPTLANYTVCLEISDLIKKEVNVEAQQEYQVTLDLNDLTVPVLIVKSKAEDNGKIIKASRGDRIYERELRNRTALYILEENGEYTVSCDDYPDIKRSILCDENKVYRLTYRTDIFGIRVIQSESDPQKRIEVIEDTDLVGLEPVSVDLDTGEVNYGDMINTFLFDHLNHVVLLSIDGQEEIELNPYDYSQKLDGTPAPSAGKDTNYNTFVKVDKLYIYEYDSAGVEYYYISEEKIDDNYTAIGFTREDDSEADAFYMSVFPGSYDDSQRLRSISDVYIKNMMTFTELATAARKNGSGYYMEQHQTITFYEVVLLMMVQNFDIINTLGMGRSYTSQGWDRSSIEAHMKESTGYLNNKGPIAYDPDTKGVKFMHIEDFWTGSWSWTEGLIYHNGYPYARMKPPYVTTNGASISTYTVVSSALRELDTTTQYQKLPANYGTACTVSNKYGRLISKGGGSMTTYDCSYTDCWNSATVTFVCVRGNGGLFSKTVQSFPSNGNSTFYARLSYLPPKKS